MVKFSFAKVKFFQKSGARLYIPEGVRGDSNFPFEDGEIVKITIGNDSLTLEKPEWWEMLDWKKMRDAYEKLPIAIREKIQSAGLAP